MYLPFWYPTRPSGLRRRWPGLPIHAPGGLPIYGAENPFQYGAAVIDPGALFFRAGNPIGPPLESFRGIGTSSFPFYAGDIGPGAPLSVWMVGIAGAPLSAKPAL